MTEPSTQPQSPARPSTGTAREKARALGSQVSQAVTQGKQSGARRALIVAGFLLFASVAYQSYHSRGASGFLIVGFLAYVAVFIVSALLTLITNPAGAVAIATIGALVALAWGIGIANPWIDGFCVLLAAFLALARAGWLLSKKDSFSFGSALQSAGVFWGVLWLTMSASDFFRDRGPLQITSDRSRRATATLVDPRVKVGIALSGGGYRAALLHAGMLHMLDSLGVPVSAISSVSGGSIIGAYYALGGDPADFLRAMIERRINLRRSLVHPLTVAHLVASSRILGTDYSVLPLDDYNRTSVQAELLDRVLFRGALHRAALDRETQRDSIPRPELMLCMTDIAGNAMIGVTPHGFVEQTVWPATTRFNFTSRGGYLNYGDFHDDTVGALPGTAKLATLVAASGAFPGALKPLHVRMLRQYSTKQLDTTEMVLADGGMADNLGLVLLYTARHLAKGYGSVQIFGVSPSFTRSVQKWNVDVVMASDGSAISVPRVPRTGFAEVSNAIDLVYRASAGEQLAGPDENPPTTLLSPESFINLLGSPDSARLYFAYDEGSDTTRLQPMGKSYTFAPPSFASLDARDLAFLVRNIDTLDSPKRRALLDATAAIERRDGPQSNSLVRPKHMGQADSLVYRAIVEDLSDVIRVFVRTSTLNDQLSTHDAQALYRLGEYLFLFNKPYLVYNANHAFGSGGFSTGVAVTVPKDSSQEALLHTKQRIFLR